MSHSPQLSDVTNLEEHWFESVSSMNRNAAQMSSVQRANWTLRYVETHKQLQFVVAKIPDGHLDVELMSQLLRRLVHAYSFDSKERSKILTDVLQMAGKSLANLCVDDDDLFLPGVLIDSPAQSILVKQPIDWSAYRRQGPRGELLTNTVGQRHRWDMMEKMLKHPHTFALHKEQVLSGWTESLCFYINQLYKRRPIISAGTLHNGISKSTMLLNKILDCSDRPQKLASYIEKNVSSTMLVNVIEQNGAWSVSAKTVQPAPKSLKNVPEEKLINKSRKSVRDVEELVSRHVSLDRYTCRGVTFLEEAVEFQNAALVKKLLDCGANVNPQVRKKLSGEKINILHYAASMMSPEIVSTLIDHGAPLEQPTSKDRFTPLHLACHRGKVEMLKVLKDKGANLNALTKIQNNALFELKNINDVNFFEAVKFLVTSGVDPFHKNIRGQTFNEYLRFEASKYGGYAVGESAVLDALDEYINNIGAYQLEKSLADANLVPSSTQQRRRM